MNLPRALPLLLLAACTPTAQAPLTDAAREAAAEEVRAASVALVAALNAHDPDSILGFYSLEEDFTYVACTEVYTGGEGYGVFTRSFHAAYPETRYDMSVQSVRVLGPDHAVVALEGTLVAPLFVTRVLRRDPTGGWLVTWEHESWPDCSGPAAPHPGTEGSDTTAAGQPGTPS